MANPAQRKPRPNGRMDLLLQGGVVVSGQGTFPANVGVRDGRIVALSHHDIVLPAEEIIDCRGRHVLPGAVDVHVHFRDPGQTDWEDFESGTRAAAAGGVTTVLEMPVSKPSVFSAEILHARKQAVASKALVDYGFYGGAGSDNLEEIEGLAAAGAVGFKTFLHAPPPGREAEFKGVCAVDPGSLLEVFRQIAKTGLVSAVHAEENSIVQREMARLQSLGRKDGLAHAESRPEIAEVASAAMVLALAKEAGVRLHLSHISTPAAVELVRAARRQGQPVTVETCPHYLLFTTEDLVRWGPFAKINPPLRSAISREAMWRLLHEEAIDAVASDHAPFLLSHKATDNIWAAPSGVPGVEMLLPLMLTESARGRLGISLLARLLCENPARIFALSPRKGTIAVGADADLVVLDMKASRTVRKAEMHTKARDIAVLYDGLQVAGAPDLVMVRGRAVARHGEVVGAPGWGKPVELQGHGANRVTLGAGYANQRPSPENTSGGVGPNRP